MRRKIASDIERWDVIVEDYLLQQRRDSADSGWEEPGPGEGDGTAVQYRHRSEDDLPPETIDVQVAAPERNPAMQPQVSRSSSRSISPAAGKENAGPPTSKKGDAEDESRKPRTLSAEEQVLQQQQRQLGLQQRYQELLTHCLQAPLGRRKKLTALAKDRLKMVSAAHSTSPREEPAALVPLPVPVPVRQLVHSSVPLASRSLPSQQVEPDQPLPASPERLTLQTYADAMLSRASAAHSFAGTEAAAMLGEEWLSRERDFTGSWRVLEAEYASYLAAAHEVASVQKTPPTQPSEPSMRHLKAEVQRLLQQHTLQQRLDCNARAVLDKLLLLAGRFRERCEFLSACLDEVDELDGDDFVSLGRRMRREIAVMREDMRACEADGWMSESRKLSEAFETLRAELAAAVQRKAGGEEQLLGIHSKLCDAQAVQSRLLESCTEVQSALNDVYRYVQGSADLRHLLLTVTRAKRAPSQPHLEFATNELQRKSFLRIRTYGRWVRHMGTSAALVSSRRSLSTKRGVFRRWRQRVVQSSRLARWVEDRQAASKAARFAAWKRLTLCGRRLALLLARRSRAAKSRGMRSWLLFAAASLRERRRSAELSLFRRRVLFRGWRRVTMRALSTRPPAVARVGDVCRRSALRQAWTAWREAAEALAVLVPPPANPSVTARRTRILVTLQAVLVESRLQASWRQWTHLYRYRLMLCVYRAKKRGFRLCSAALRERSARRRSSAAAALRAAGWGAFRRWRAAGHFLRILGRLRGRSGVRLQKMQSKLRLRRLQRLLASWIRAFLFRLGQSTSRYREEAPAMTDRTAGNRTVSRGGPVEVGTARGSARPKDRPKGVWRASSLGNVSEGPMEEDLPLEHLAAAVRGRASLNATRRCFSHLLQAFLSSQRQKQLVFRALQRPDDSPYPSSSTGLAAEVADFLRQRRRTKSSLEAVSAAEAEGSQLAKAAALREETEQLQARLAALDLQLHQDSTLRADLQASVEALQRAIDVCRRSIESILLDEAGEQGDEQPPEPAPVAVPDRAGELQRMEGLYQRAVRALSAADGGQAGVEVGRQRLRAARLLCRERDEQCEQLRRQRDLFRSQAQDLARAVDDALERIASQAKEYDAQIEGLQEEAAALEQEQQELHRTELRLREQALCRGEASPLALTILPQSSSGPQREVSMLPLPAPPAVPERGGAAAVEEEDLFGRIQSVSARIKERLSLAV